MKNLFITYETKDGNGNKIARAGAIPQGESITWWLKKNQAEDCFYCFWSPTWKEAVAMAESWNESYRINKVEVK